MCLFRKLAGKTLFITGASRGIGKSIALKAAKDGANIVIAAKTATPHPKLPGTIYTAAKESKLGNEDTIQVKVQSLYNIPHFNMDLDITQSFVVPKCFYHGIL